MRLRRVTRKTLILQRSAGQQMRFTNTSGLWHRYPYGCTTYLFYFRCTEDLDACLQTLQDTSARLGASMGVLSAAHKFRQRLRVVLISFRLNAEALHPDLKSILHPTNALLSQRDSTHGVPVEELPEQLSLLANDASAFLEQITFFSDFVQDAVKEPIMGCRNDLDVCSVQLAHYEPHPISHSTSLTA